MYSGIYAGSEKIKSVFLGSSELYKSGYKSATVKRISGVSTARELAYVDMGDYLLLIAFKGIYKITKESASAELIATPNMTSIPSSYKPCLAWRRGTNEIVVMFNDADGYILAILDTTSWEYTKDSNILTDSDTGTYPTGCYDATKDLVYFWKSGELRTWNPKTNAFTTNNANTTLESKLFVDVDGSLRTFDWHKTDNAQVYNVVNGVESKAYTINVSEWADEYSANNNGFAPNDKGLAYQLTTDTVIEINLNTRTAKGYPLSSKGLYYGGVWGMCTKQGFLATNVLNSTDLYLMVLE